MESNCNKCEKCNGKYQYKDFEDICCHKKKLNEISDKIKDYIEDIFKSNNIEYDKYSYFLNLFHKNEFEKTLITANSKIAYNELLLSLENTLYLIFNNNKISFNEKFNDINISIYKIVSMLNL